LKSSFRAVAAVGVERQVGGRQGLFLHLKEQVRNGFAGRDGHVDGRTGRAAGIPHRIQRRDVARWFWAMAQMAPLSLALLMRLPVLIRLAWYQFGVGRFRFCSATSAPDVGVDAIRHRGGPFLRTGVRSGAGGVLPARQAAMPGPSDGYDWEV
jgi:hypothetical protein